MLHRQAIPVLTLAVLGLLAGCASNGNPTTQTTRPAGRTGDATESRPAADLLKKPSLIYQEVTAGEKLKADDNLWANLQVVRISSPTGTLAADPDLWRVVSDRPLSPDQQRFFASNGLRVGYVEVAAWEGFKKVSDRHAGVVSRTINIVGDRRAEIDVAAFPQQSLFYFARDGSLHGRTYDNCENFWAVSYVPEPAHAAASVRLELCPVVRAARKQLQYSRANSEYEVSLIRPESLYDVGLKLTVPVGMLLVVAPTPESAGRPGSIAQAFLTAQEPAGMRDTLLVIYPRLFRFDAQATNARIEQFLKEESRKGQLPKDLLPPER